MLVLVYVMIIKKSIDILYIFYQNICSYCTIFVREKEILIATKIIGTEGLEPSLRTQAIALPLSYVPRGRQQAFACCLVGFDVSRRPYAFGLIHATIISRKYPFVVTHFFIFLSGAFLSFPLNHTVCICHRKHER